MSAEAAGTQDHVVAAGDTVGQALVRLRDSGHGLGVVVDEAGAVIGTLTDSAVRRSALRDPTLATPVGDVMTSTPVVATPGLDDAIVADLLTAHRLRAIPVVDGGRLVGVRSIEEFPDRKAVAPIAVLMVGGKGERLRPLTDKVPKPLLKIGAHSIVERIILAVADAGVREVYLAVNYLAEQFEEKLGSGADLGVTIRYLYEDEPMGSAGALSLLPEVPAAPVLVSNGDLVTTVDYTALFDYHWHHRGAVTITGVEHRTYIPYGVLQTAEHHLLGIEEKPERRDFVSAGMYVLQPEVLRFLPGSGRSGMPDLIDAVVAEGLPVNVFPILEAWADIGSPEELERVMLMFATGEEE